MSYYAPPRRHDPNADGTPSGVLERITRLLGKLRLYPEGSPRLARWGAWLVLPPALAPEDSATLAMSSWSVLTHTSVRDARGWPPREARPLTEGTTLRRATRDGAAVRRSGPPRRCRCPARTGCTSRSEAGQQAPAEQRGNPRPSGTSARHASFVGPLRCEHTPF